MINLATLLKDCPKGTTFWCDGFGMVELDGVSLKRKHPIKIWATNRYGFKTTFCLCPDGSRSEYFPGHCVLWPSKNCRTWEGWKYTACTFDPNMLNPGDQVLVRNDNHHDWTSGVLERVNLEGYYLASGKLWRYCIPYNDETSFLLGRPCESPEKYRYYPSGIV